MSGEAGGNGRHRIKFDPSFNLGHVFTIVAFLVSGALAYASMDARIAQQGKAAEENKAAIATKADKEAVGKGELELSRRIVENRQYVDQTMTRTASDVSEIKTLMREGFRDLHQQLDRKVDKPGR